MVIGELSIERPFMDDLVSVIERMCIVMIQLSFLWLHLIRESCGFHC